MPNKEPQLIDGFHSVQAIKRSGKAAEQAPKLRHSATRLPQAEAAPAPPPPTNAAATRIGHTAIPEKHALVCYECRFAFVVSGKVHYTFCPKCKRNLDMSDHVVEGECRADIRTMGAIDIRPGTVVGAVTLIAQTLVIGSDVTRATLQATRRVELAAGGRVLKLADIPMKELVIRPGAQYAFPEGISIPVLDIAGTLVANVRAEDRIIIRATGDFRGELVSPRLQVEDGATIHAAMFLGAAATAVPQEAKHAA